MDLRYAAPGDDIAGLWREVFPGDDGKVYFDREFASAGVLVYEDGGRVVSMLNWTNQLMRLWGEEIPCAYILGIGTRPEYRGKGLAGDLLEQALFELHLRKIPLTCLIPAKLSLVDFYAKYGFLQVGAGMKAPKRIERYPKAGRADIPALGKLYERLMSGFAHMTRPSERWEIILDEYDVEFDGGGGYGVYDRGVWLEGTGGTVSGGLPGAACVKIVELNIFERLAEKKGKPTPSNHPDRYCPWNGLDGAEASPSAEKLWFTEEPPYINLLYN